MTQPAIDAGVSTLPSFHSSLGITIGYARPERVMGEMKIGPQHLGLDGAIHLGAVVGFASELALHGAQLALSPGKIATTIDVKTNLFKPCHFDFIGGDAVPLHASDTVMVWQISIIDPAGKVAASISQTLLVRETQETTGATALTGASPDDAVAEFAPLRGGSRATSSKRNKEATAPTIAEARRNQIASAACNVIARKGFANATIREIADAANLHVPTLYQYVSSKDEVLELVYRWAMERVSTNVGEATAGSITARDKLSATVKAMLANGDRDKRLVGVLNRELKSLQPIARQRVLDQYKEFLQSIADLIAEGVANGEFRTVDPFIAANFVEALTDLWSLRQFAVGKAGLDAFQRQALSFILAALVE